MEKTQKKDLKKILAAAALAVILSALIFIIRQTSSGETGIRIDKENPSEETQESGGDSKEEETAGKEEKGDKEEKELGVHVSGAVKDPDKVWMLPEGSRIADAIEAAGGVLKNADLSLLNLADHLMDGEKIYVPFQGEEAESRELITWPEEKRQPEGAGNEVDNDTPSPSDETSHLTNINSADKIELTELPGIGESIAGRIIEYRNTYGPFKTIEEIMNVSGIGENKFAQIEDLITVE